MRRGTSGISVKKAGVYLDRKATMASIQWPSGATLLWSGRVAGEYVQDESGNGYHGWMNGPVVQRGAWGDCLYLDGVNDAVAADAVPLNFDEMSIIVLINTQSLPAQWESTLGISNNDDNYFSLTCRGKGIRPYFLIAGENKSFAFDMLVNRNFWELWQFDMSKSGDFLRLYINNILVYSANTYPGNASKNYNIVFGAKMKCLMGAFAIYERVLSAAERTGLFLQLFPNKRGDLVVFEGDSLTAPSDATTCYPFHLMSTHPGRWANFATGGELVNTHFIPQGSVIDAMQVDDGQNIICVLGGTNDLANGRTVEQVEADLQTYCAARRAAGWVVILLTIPNRIGSTSNQDVNIWLNANYATFADAIVDVAAEPNLADPTDLTYFQEDGVHLTTLGYAVVADCVAVELEKLYFGGARY